jgi:GNAT superfamily N-acetyltransferase
MILLKTMLSELISAPNLEADVDKLEQATNSKYSEAIKRFMVYYNKSKHCIELSDIYLKPEYYGKGGGSKIMKDLIDFADSKELPIILIPESERGSNKKLIDFYKKFGFVVNKGRGMNYQLAIPFALSMFRLPK